jgi:hypothetical protein
MHDALRRTVWNRVPRAPKARHKVARGEREARCPWIRHSNDSRPNGPTEIVRRLSLSPVPGSSLFLRFQGYLLIAPSARGTARVLERERHRLRRIEPPVFSSATPSPSAHGTRPCSRARRRAPKAQHKVARGERERAAPGSGIQMTPGPMGRQKMFDASLCRPFRARRHPSFPGASAKRAAPGSGIQMTPGPMSRQKMFDASLCRPFRARRYSFVSRGEREARCPWIRVFK